LSGDRLPPGIVQGLEAGLDDLSIGHRANVSRPANEGPAGDHDAVAGSGDRQGKFDRPATIQLDPSTAGTHEPVAGFVQGYHSVGGERVIDREHKAINQ
jgi:hypothetical protein